MDHRESTKSNSAMNLETEEPVPRFLIIKRIDGGDFAKVSPFVIDKTLYGLIGQVKAVRKIKEGLLVETTSKPQSIRLLKIEKFGDFPVEITPHKALNYSKGVITCRDLLNCSTQEILKGVQPAGVIEIKRITTRREGNLVDTASLILTFNTPTLPKTIKVAFYSLKVRLISRLFCDASDVNDLAILLFSAINNRFVFVDRNRMRVLHAKLLLPVLTVVDHTQLELKAAPYLKRSKQSKNSKLRKKYLLLKLESVLKKTFQIFQ